MLTDEQIERVFALLLGCEPWACDTEIIQALGGTSDAVADYIWDHMMGEPDTPTWHQVQQAVGIIVDHPDLSDDEVIDLAVRATAA